MLHTQTHTHIYKSKGGYRSRGRPEGSILNSYYTNVLGRALLLSLLDLILDT